MFCGPEFYQPDNENMLTALSQYQRIIDGLVPKDSTTTNQNLWGNDRHEDKLFVDQIITGKLRVLLTGSPATSRHSSNHNHDLAFLD